METKAQIIARLKATYPSLRQGSEEIGYTELDSEAYEATISQWADNELAQNQSTAAKENAEAKLVALGLTADDLKALGLGNN
jgi:hypothetical protein